MSTSKADRAATLLESGMQRIQDGQIERPDLLNLRVVRPAMRAPVRQDALQRTSRAR